MSPRRVAGFAVRVAGFAVRVAGVAVRVARCGEFDCGLRFEIYLPC